MAGARAEEAAQTDQRQAPTREGRYFEIPQRTISPVRVPPYALVLATVFGSQSEGVTTCPHATRRTDATDRFIQFTRRRPAPPLGPDPLRRGCLLSSLGGVEMTRINWIGAATVVLAVSALPEMSLARDLLGRVQLAGKPVAGSKVTLWRTAGKSAPARLVEAST